MSSRGAEPQAQARRVSTARVLSAACALALSIAAPSTVAAHAPPYALRIAWQTSGYEAALITNRGILFGEPTEHRWRLMCNEALHINTSEQPEFAYLPDGRLMVATSRGLRVTADEGCTWQGVEPFGSTSTPAFAQDPDSPATLYAGTYGTGMSAVRVSEDSGATWRVLLEAADNDFIQEILLAPGKHERLYVSGEALSDGVFSHYVARSDDAGKTWARFAATLIDTEVDLTLLAISPSDPDTVLAIAVAAEPTLMQDRVLVSSDGGETFEERGTFSGVLGGGFSADGAVAWVVGPMGLLRSDDGAKTFAPVSGPSSMSCMFERGTTTYGCGWYEAGKNGVGASEDRGGAFTPWMAFTDVTEPVHCSDDTETASLCSTLWRDWQREIFGIWDAGTPTMVMDAAMPPPPDTGTPRQPDAGVIVQPAAGGAGGAVLPEHHGASDGGGCAVRPQRGEAGPWLELALGWLAVTRWRRRARRR
jgi:photosystem II stability/assembly factor-like uncharacterized protein